MGRRGKKDRGIQDSNWLEKSRDLQPSLEVLERTWRVNITATDDGKEEEKRKEEDGAEEDEQTATS